MPVEIAHALSTWLLLGGVGKRSRRMLGGLHALAISPSDDFKLADEGVAALSVKPIPKNPQTWAKVIADHLNRRLFAGGVVTRPHVPQYPTLHPDHSRIVVGERTFASAQEANQALFRELLRTTSLPSPRPSGVSSYRQEETMFGYARRERRASPLIAQVRPVVIDGKTRFVPVLTVMRSPIRRPDNRPTDWSIYNTFLDDAERIFKGVTVWGGHFK